MNSRLAYQLILEYFEHKPTTSQYQAIERLDDFLLSSPPNTAFVLRGYAGTGKTTLVGALVKTLPQLKLKFSLLAPTGRAAKVLSGYSGQPAYTIHKKIYQLEKGNDDIERFVLAENKQKNTLFIVDESSMISAVRESTTGNGLSGNLLDDLISFVYSGQNCKVLFVGDIAQLPPVGSQLSPALTPRYLFKEYNLKIKGAELTDVVRQEKGSGILENATALRELIKQETVHIPQFEVDDFPDFQSITGNDLEDALNESYDQYGAEETLIVCRSNKRANLFNQQVRARILWKEEELAAGDLMMVVKNNYAWLPKESKAGFIANGDSIEIMKVIRYEETYGFHFADVMVRLVDYPDEPELEVKLILDTVNAETPALTRQQNKDLYYAILEDYHTIENKRQRYKKLKADPYLNALQVKFAYAVTCHKAQGGQWSSVFVDQGYLTSEMIDVDFLRWLYTALTRATEKLYLVNFNKEFFKKQPETFY